MKVDHVPGFIVSEGKVLLIRRFHEDVVVDPFRSEERRRKVIVSADDPDLEILVF